MLKKLKYCLMNESGSPSIEILICSMIGLGLTVGVMAIKTNVHQLSTATIKKAAAWDSSFT